MWIPHIFYFCVFRQRCKTFSELFMTLLKYISLELKPRKVCVFKMVYFCRLLDLLGDNGMANCDFILANLFCDFNFDQSRQGIIVTFAKFSIRIHQMMSISKFLLSKIQQPPLEKTPNTHFF